MNEPQAGSRRDFVFMVSVVCSFRRYFRHGGTLGR
jgi:hypothetical protein